MNKKQTKHEGLKKKEKPIPLGLSARNYQIFGLGLLVLIIGYFFLSKGPAESFWSLTFSPILLFIGYCIIIPFAILYRNKQTVAKINNNSGD